MEDSHVGGFDDFGECDEFREISSSCETLEEREVIDRGSRRIPPYFLSEDMVVNGLELVKPCKTRKWSTQFHRKRFHRENGTTFSEVPFFPEIFQWNEPKKHVH